MQKYIQSLLPLNKSELNSGLSWGYDIPIKSPEQLRSVFRVGDFVYLKADGLRAGKTEGYIGKINRATVLLKTEYMGNPLEIKCRLSDFFTRPGAFLKRGTTVHELVAIEGV